MSDPLTDFQKQIEKNCKEFDTDNDNMNCLKTRPKAFEDSKPSKDPIVPTDDKGHFPLRTSTYDKDSNVKPEMKVGTIVASKTRNASKTTKR